MYSTTTLVSSGIILSIISVSVVCLRLFVRLHSQKTSSIDDCLICISTVLFCAMSGCVFAGALHGEWGRDGEVIEPVRERITDKAVYALVAIEKLAYGVTKLSFLFFYRRLFGISPTFRITNNIFISLIILWMTFFFFLELFICGAHPSAGWNGNPDHEKCLSQENILLAFAITDVVGDVAVLSMPYPVIRKLQMGVAKKVGVAGVFMLGGFAIIAGIIRLGFIARAYGVSGVIYNAAGKTVNGDNSPKVFWTIMEVFVAIVAACLPVLAPLFQHLPSPSQSVSYIKEMRYFKVGKRVSFSSDVEPLEDSLKEGRKDGIGMAEVGGQDSV